MVAMASLSDSVSPPSYSPQTTPSFNNIATSAAKPTRKAPPPVDILLLGSPSTGKATFLSRLPQLSQGPVTAKTPLPSQPTDLNRRPFTYSVTLFARPYTFHIWPSTTTLFTDPFPDNPKFVIITYDITSRASLWNAQYYWRRQFTSHYMDLEHTTPVMLLGLKRDLRTEEMGEDGKTICVMPQEGVNAASDMRCDKYAECSAVTGELLWEAVEDITRVAARTTTEGGGLAGGSPCCVM